MRMRCETCWPRIILVYIRERKSQQIATDRDPSMRTDRTCTYTLSLSPAPFLAPPGPADITGLT